MSDTRTAVLRALSRAGGEFVSGERLGADAGVTRAAVAKTVEACRGLGYGIESIPRRGHRLVSRPDLLLPFEIVDGLTTSAMGRQVHHFTTLPSTQVAARRLAEDGAPHGTVVVAEEQTAGRGRGGTAYWCPPGGIWATVVLRGPLAATVAPLVPIAAGVALSRAVTGVSGIHPLLKWPNDLLIRGRKVAGILTELFAEEGRVEYLLVGMGLNVNVHLSASPAGIADCITSVAAEAGHPMSRRALLQLYLGHLESLFTDLLQGRTAVIPTAWRQLPNCLGLRVQAAADHGRIEGVAESLRDDGALVVRGPDGTADIIGSPITLLDELPTGRV